MNAGYFYCPYIPLDNKKAMNEHLENLECTVIGDAPTPEVVSVPFPFQSRLLREELEEMRVQVKEAEEARIKAEAAATRMSLQLEAMKQNVILGNPPADLEVRMYEEYDKKMKEVREFMIDSVDKFFKYRLEEYQGNVEAMVANTTPEKFLDEAIKCP